MKKPVLVVLAAGLGSRYGGLKQMDSLGKSGEVLLDYSVYDALRSGFGKVVFIIRHEIEGDFKELVLRRMGSAVPCSLAYQELDSLVPPDILTAGGGRTKPWGTAHALLCAEDQIDAPFAAINADDFYGKEAFDAMGRYLASPEIGEGAIVPYDLEKTLSPQGTVTRGVCEVRNGYLASVNELKAIEKQGNVIFNTGEDGKRQELAPDTPVSMNFWGFPESVFPRLREYFDAFLTRFGREPKTECYLPMAADWLIKNDFLKIRLLEANASWFGVTYREDRETALRHIADLTGRGVYPERLWS